MLKNNPQVGQFIEVLETDVFEDTQEQYQTKGDTHEIVGVSKMSGCPYFIGDLDEPVYIDDSAYHLYKIYEDNKKIKAYLAHSISTTGEFNDSIRVANRLREIGLDVYAAAENKSINDKRNNNPTPVDIYNGDVSMIVGSDIFIANLNGNLQDGTISEIGLASGLNEARVNKIPIVAYSSNARLLNPQHYKGISSASANHLVLGMIDKWGEWVGSEDNMINKVAEVVKTMQ